MMLGVVIGGATCVLILGGIIISVVGKYTIEDAIKYFKEKF